MIEKLKMELIPIRLTLLLNGFNYMLIVAKQ